MQNWWQIAAEVFLQTRDLGRLPMFASQKPLFGACDRMVALHGLTGWATPPETSGSLRNDHLFEQWTDLCPGGCGY
jgi:hypothetical protein